MECLQTKGETAELQQYIDDQLLNNYNNLDQIVENLKLSRVDFIKMDIEGAELKALQGARETIMRHKPYLAIAVEHTADRLRNARQVRELVLSINSEYRCVPGPYRFTGERRLAPEILYFD